MLSKFVALGDKIELQPIARRNGTEEGKTYISKVYEIISEDTLEILMPMEQTRLILLPVDEEYDLVFYGETGLYQAFVRIVDRYKSNNVYLLRVELTSDLRKHQRREFYRFSCALEITTRCLDEEELQAAREHKPFLLRDDMPLQHCVMVDISGGGLRFVSTSRYAMGNLLCCGFLLSREGVGKQYDVVGEVLATKELENRPGTYEHRIRFYDMRVETREEIIRFIFEEERKSRKRERLS